MKNERWRASALNGYQVSSAGNIRNEKTGKLLRPMRKPSGYLYITKVIDGKKRNIYVHRLVALAFVKNPMHKPLVNHKDGNKGNNSSDNLEWMTCSENTLHAYKQGLIPISDIRSECSRQKLLNMTPAQRQKRRERWRAWWDSLTKQEQYERMCRAANARKVVIM